MPSFFTTSPVTVHEVWLLGYDPKSLTNDKTGVLSVALPPKTFFPAGQAALALTSVPAAAPFTLETGRPETETVTTLPAGPTDPNSPVGPVTPAGPTKPGPPTPPAGPAEPVGPPAPAAPEAP